jgi:translation initiation factor IF-2
LEKEKIRIYALARELDMESKALLDMCRQHGIDVKNQLSSIDPEMRDQIVQLVQRGGSVATAAPPPRAAALPTAPTKPIPVLDTRRPTRPAPDHAAPKPVSPPAPAPQAVVPPSEPAISPPPAAVAPSPPPPPPRTPEAPPVKPIEPAPAAEAPAAEPPPAPRPPAPVPPPTRPLTNVGGMRNLGGAPRPPQGGAPPSSPRPLPNVGHGAGARDRRPMGRPSNLQRAPQPPPPLKQQGTPPKKPVQPPQPTGARKLSDIPTNLQPSREGGSITIEEILRKQKEQQPAGGRGGVAPVEVPIEDEDDDRKGKGGGAKRGPGGVVGRDARHLKRSARQKERAAEVVKSGTRVADLLLEDDAPRRLKDRLKKKKPQATEKRKGKVPIATPISVRTLSEAIGVKSAALIFKLMAAGAPPTTTINSLLDVDMAETIALEQGIELDVKRGRETEANLVAEAKKPDDPSQLQPRAPIVTIMGHVDHGKTSLLDKIRSSNVAATEAGGITQVIRAWRVEHDGKPITFLDTPGHEAFTKMRARGAHVTDIAVIVVAADDGVMPQTEEAINHAKAAGVSIVVAINKVDLPNANLRKTEQQLYGLGVLPDNMGGDSPFVQTSAATGKGIDELLDQISVVAEIKELKANPNKPGVGTCLEANLTEGEGVFATFLVQDGTLKRGDVVLCGATYGRVRAMYDDLGRPIQEAGPSMPCRITGLDEVPNADDPFLVVEDLSTAREVAEKRSDKAHEAELQPGRSSLKLESLTETKVVELKVILKADFRGSIEAIRKELEKLRHEEVAVRVLSAGIGAITENDVQLALTSPRDTLVLGFNVVPDDRALALAEERGIKIHEYAIIYKLTDDVRSALEGKLKPREEVIHLGRAVVRETFKISRVGTIAGCYVTQGIIERNAKVRVIRSGVVVYPPADRTCALDSLKRFKEDVKEVREGFECGIKVAGYDDVKVDDVIEAYRIEQVQRTLS